MLLNQSHKKTLCSMAIGLFRKCRRIPRRLRLGEQFFGV